MWLPGKCEKDPDDQHVLDEDLYRSFYNDDPPAPTRIQPHPPASSRTHPHPPAPSQDPPAPTRTHPHPATISCIQPVTINTHLIQALSASGKSSYVYT